MSEGNEKIENKGKSKSASVVDTAANIQKLRKIVNAEAEIQTSEGSIEN